jgi:hypothetical protein
LPPTNTRHFQASADAKFADYQPKFAFFFPGQGAQSVGMAKVSGGEGCDVFGP